VLPYNALPIALEVLVTWTGRRQPVKLDYFRVADNPGVDIATSGLSPVDYGAENGAGKRWV
jgi:hypothetical protein